MQKYREADKHEIKRFYQGQSLARQAIWLWILPEFRGMAFEIGDETIARRQPQSSEVPGPAGQSHRPATMPADTAHPRQHTLLALKFAAPDAIREDVLWKYSWFKLPSTYQPMALHPTLTGAATTTGKKHRHEHAIFFSGASILLLFFANITCTGRDSPFRFRLACCPFLQYLWCWVQLLPSFCNSAQFLFRFRFRSL